jgi:hypothetical protein
MNFWKGSFTALAIISAAGMSSAATIDTRDASNPGPGSTYFVPDPASTQSAPYYRWHDEDWGWTHGAIVGAITLATLNISAWDVDEQSSDGERDLIEIFDVVSSGWVMLPGYLTGDDNQYSYSTFDLSGYFASVNVGLQVRLDIDSTHDYDYWAVAIAKSVVSVDGGVLPDPDPGPSEVPVPAALPLLVGAISGLAYLGRRRRR